MCVESHVCSEIRYAFETNNATCQIIIDYLQLFGITCINIIQVSNNYLGFEIIYRKITCVIIISQIS